jgi:hypothetical protein
VSGGFLVTKIEKKNKTLPQVSLSQVQPLYFSPKFHICGETLLRSRIGEAGKVQNVRQ